MIYSGINQLISNNIWHKEIRRYRGSRETICKWLSRKSYFMQRKQVLIPSAIIALRSLKPNIYIFIHRFGKNMQANKQQQK